MRIDRALKFTVAFTFAVSVASFVVDVGYGVRFLRAPMHPVVATGQVVPFNVHGSVVFVTAPDAAVEHVLSVIAPGAIAITALLAFWLKRRQRL